jgi:hypothetical protein
MSGCATGRYIQDRENCVQCYWESTTGGVFMAHVAVQQRALADAQAVKIVRQITGRARFFRRAFDLMAATCPPLGRRE